MPPKKWARSLESFMLSLMAAMSESMESYMSWETHGDELRSGGRLFVVLAGRDGGRFGRGLRSGRGLRGGLPLGGRGRRGG
mmetsp:Transcript_36903/g.89016  ORF Transcript_36903/g.89016 Transcript_36903/m.89016 type:complete len:81 (+) Transcript_36903:1111-1353(+)